jgi:pantetheine-phosphate adenylyltransferase
MFERVIVAVAAVTGKQPLFTIDERVAMIREAVEGLPNVDVDFFSGLVVDFAAARGASAIVKGLRVVSDFEHERQMALMNTALAPGIETVFLLTSVQNLFLSSSLVRQVASLGGDIEPFVPPGVLRRLQDRFSKDD